VSVTSPLDSLVGKTLSAEQFDSKEFEGLKASGLARLKDAENRSLSLPGRFDLAYNASFALCLAALRYHGFRAEKRYTVFQVLPHTLGLGPEVWRVLDKAHNLRNRGEYDGSFDIDERIVTDLIAACRVVASKLEKMQPR
jgi:hypothetical protein